MDALGLTSALDGDFTSASDGGDLESLVTLLRSQVRKAGVDSLCGAAAQPLAATAPPAHPAAHEARVEERPIACDEVGAAVHSSSLKSASLEVCACFRSASRLTAKSNRISLFISTTAGACAGPRECS